MVLEEHQIIQYTWPTSEFLWLLGFPPFLNLLNLPGFLWKLLSPQPAPRFCPCFLRNIFFLLLRKKDLRKRFPHKALTALRPPSASSQCCSLYPECSHQSPFQPILFYFVVKSNSAHRRCLCSFVFQHFFFIRHSKKC